MPLSHAVQTYLAAKSLNTAESREARGVCVLCRKPQVTCYCDQLAPLASDPEFMILMHPREARHPVGTGRMAHRGLSNSSLIVGYEFDNNPVVAKLLADPNLFPVLLFPGLQTKNLSELDPGERRELIPAGKRGVVIVLDATWHHARKMLHHSPALQRLPRISFVPRAPSEFLVRKQPAAHCLSTIEAICEVITLMGEAERAALVTERLMTNFRQMVKKQLGYRTKHPVAVSRHSKGYHERKERRLRNKELKKRRP